MFIPLTHTVRLEGDARFGWRFLGLVAAGLLLVAYWQQWVRSPFQWDLAIALTFIFGYRTFTRAFQDLLARKVSADQAVTLAALAALYVGEYLAAAEVVYIMLVGETLEDYAARKFQTDLNRLLSCLPHEASVLRNGREQKVHLGEIEAGDRVVVYPGQRLPVDGKILEGESLLDESSITGESLPRERLPGEGVYAGTLNQTSRLVVEARQVGEETVLNRIVHLVRHAKENKAPIQRTADRYARWFLPLVVSIAAVCYLLTGEWMRSVAILIVACPCAMVLATPAAVLASISHLARRGSIIKGGVHLEKLAQVSCVAFDKTGTLTRGRPELIDTVPLDGFNPQDILSWAASLESFSEHLLASAIRSAAESRGLPLYTAAGVHRHAGLGMEGQLSLPAGETVHLAVGSARFLQQQGFQLSPSQKQAVEAVANQGAIPVLVARDRKLAGLLVLRDSPRPEAAATIRQLHQLGIHKSVLLTGDNPVSAAQIAGMVGISDVHADLLPEEKLNRLHELKQQGYVTAMVGDGVNDSPSLAAADVGIAMGDTGTDIAADAAGVVLMGEGGLDRLPELVRTSRHTVKTIQDNIFWFGLAFNLAAVLAAFLGYISAIGAAVVHQVSSFLVLMNSLKLLKRRPAALLPRRLQEVAHRLGHRLEHARHHLSWPGLKHWAEAHSGQVARATLLLASGAYVLSGAALIQPHEAGLVQRFGRVLQEPLQPGLHYVFPWPLEQLHRFQPDRIWGLELGFRTGQDPARMQEPPAYEWNTQHRQGRYIRQPDEALMLTGDEYLVEVTAVVQYSILDPKLFLFRTDNLEDTLRAICEGALRYVVATLRLDQVLALDRHEVERVAAEMVSHELQQLALGVRIHSFYLQDVHPALEVVGAFRDVASALEEKSRMINQAQAYANERLPLARGESQKRLIEAAAYRLRRVNRSLGEAERFNAHYEAYRLAPQTTRTRLYLEAVEAALADKNKYILDQRSGRRKMLLFKDSVLNFGELEKTMKSQP